MLHSYRFITLLNEYLDDGVVGLKPYTQRCYEWHAKPLRHFFRGYYLCYDPELVPSGKHLNGAAIERYRQIRMNAVSPSTVQKELLVGCNAVNYQKRERYKSIDNPFEGRLLPRKYRKLIRPRSVILPRDRESDLLIKCVQPLRDVVRLMIEIGLRKSEVLALEWNMIHGDVIRFRPDQHKSGNYAETIITAGAREIIEAQPRVATRVFTANGKPITRDWLRNRWEGARNAAGLGELTMHDLRRTCGHRMREMGIGLDAIQPQMRHADFQTTQSVYAPSQISLARQTLSNLRLTVSGNYQ